MSEFRITIKSVFSIVIVIILLFGCKDQTQEGAEILYRAHKERKKIPLLSQVIPGLDNITAYRIQKAYVEKRLSDNKIAGFKAGLTSKGGQKKFGVQSPLAGVLFVSGRKGNEAILKKSDFRLMMIETEIGYVAGRRITQRLKDSELDGVIQSVMPVIELPDLGFADLKKLRGVDIVAANVASASFIIGDKRKFKGLALNDIKTVLTLDGAIVNKGTGNDAMGDQRRALLWLINTIIDQGWKIEKGQILITGALGKMIRAKTGKYNADFGKLGKISFKILP